MERGPGLLHGCRVKIWGSKNRGRTWDYDRCYVRILSVVALVDSLLKCFAAPKDSQLMQLPSVGRLPCLVISVLAICPSLCLKLAQFRDKSSCAS